MGLYQNDKTVVGRKILTTVFGRFVWERRQRDDARKNDDA